MASSFPRRTLENALRVPEALKEKNGGNPWPPAQVADALGVGAKSGNFFYVAGASRDYGLTEGSRDTAEIKLTELGRRAVYPGSSDEERRAKLDAFLYVEAFREVLNHFHGNNLPERKFLENTLHKTYGIDPTDHDEFVDIFQKNCRYLGIGSEWTGVAEQTPTQQSAATGDHAITVAASKHGSDGPTCFVIMPFTERDDRHQTGFFMEVLDQIFSPAATAAGFNVTTAERQGSDVIQSTIVNDLLAADLVLADLTEHNPNVLFELGMRMREDRPTALVRAKGTGQIFDVDNVLRVVDYDPNVWPSTVERDIPRVREHLEATWGNRDSADTYMKILRRQQPGSV
jgi:hypothetical protein